MKKSLVVLAVLSAAGVASAQSSVTLFGVVDTAVSSYSNTSNSAFGTSITTSKTALVNSGYGSTRLGFRGEEDLGGGLAAGFWLESSLGTDDGTAGAGINSTTPSNQLFNRRSTVSLSGVFGEVRIGRDYVPTFWNDAVFDPYGTVGVGTNLVATASGYGPGAPSGFTANSQYIRASNSIGYFLPPNLGGFYGQFMYAMNENTSYDPGGLTPPGVSAFLANPSAPGTNGRAGRYIGGRVGYTKGPLNVAFAYGETTLASNYFAGTTRNLDIWNIGASWDFGVAKVFGEYSNNKLRDQSASGFVTGATNPFAFRAPGANGGLIGVTVPVGPGLIRVSYSTVKYNNTSNVSQLTGWFSDPKAEKWAVGYVHNLSTRTALYATAACVNNKDGASLIVGGPVFYTTPITINGVTSTPQAQRSVGYDFGIRHVF